MGNTIDNKHTIDVNGKRYDAISGAYLGSSPTAGQAIAKTIHSVHGGHGKSVDGFTRVSRGQTTRPLQPVKHVTKHSANLASAKIRTAHSPAVHVAHHTPQKAKTLMRTAVTKPDIKSPAHITAHSRTDMLAKVPQQTVAPKTSFNSVNLVRHKRAERMIQNSNISRYNKITTVPAVHKPTVAHTQYVQPAGQPAAASPHQPSHLRPMRGDIGRPVQQHSAPAAAQRPVLPVERKEDIFTKALADARSHEQVHKTGHHKSKRRSRFVRYASAGAAALLLLGFFAYQNTDNISLKVASYRSGLDAKLPAVQPAGYALGSLDYKAGDVTINFKSADSADRKFNISQKTSSWDSQALLSNFVASANSAYKTYQQAGRTVYVLGNNTATWVDSGIWYTVNGNTSLSSKQLLELAGSM